MRGQIRHRLRFFVADAWDELRRSPGVHFLAVATLASSLFLAGLVLLVISNIEQRVERLRADVRLEVYLQEGIAEADRSRLQNELRAMDGVARVEYVDQALALERYREWAGEMADLIEELDTNPLPASLEVFLEPGPDAEARGEAVVDALGDRAAIEQVRFDRQWLRRLESMLDLARVGGAGLAVLVFGAVVFVMASVLRLAVYARRDEIEIMLLVGASPTFVRGPFLVAGLGQAVTASTLALVLVEAARRGALSYAGDDRLALLELVAASPVTLSLGVLVVGMALLVSLVSSWFAVRQSF